MLSRNSKIPPAVALLPIFIVSILLELSAVRAELAVRAPSTWSSLSEKYCPPITVTALALPSPPTPPSPINNLSPLLPCVPT